MFEGDSSLQYTGIFNFFYSLIISPVSLRHYTDPALITSDQG